ncbi:hypothetical protein [Streptomyces sp. NPDC002346]
MTDEEITDLWCEIARDVGPDTASKIQRLMDGMAERQERRDRAQVVADLQAEAARDWPGIGLLLHDINGVVLGGVDGEPREG